jgi:hypothetical protein
VVNHTLRYHLSLAVSSGARKKSSVNLVVVGDELVVVGENMSVAAEHAGRRRPTTSATQT